MKNKEWIKIIVSIVLIIISLVIESEPTKLILLIISYTVIGLNVYKNSLKNIKKLEIFDENFLMVIATLGAFYIGSPVEAVIVMLLYEIGEY